MKYSAIKLSLGKIKSRILKIFDWFLTIYQFISFFPKLFNISFVFEKCLQPKKPL
jgi:hypothetical protein